MGEGLHIRAASIHDVARLAAWACTMARETEDKRLDPDVVRRGITAVLDEPRRGRYFVACIDDETVGTLMLTYEWSDWRCADWWWPSMQPIWSRSRWSGPRMRTRTKQD